MVQQLIRQFGAPTTFVSSGQFWILFETTLRARALFIDTELMCELAVVVLFSWPCYWTANSTKAPINLPVNKQKDDDFYGIVKFLPKFSIMTSY